MDPFKVFHSFASLCFRISMTEVLKCSSLVLFVMASEHVIPRSEIRPCQLD